MPRGLAVGGCRSCGAPGLAIAPDALADAGAAVAGGNPTWSPICVFRGIFVPVDAVRLLLAAVLVSRSAFQRTILCVLSHGAEKQVRRINADWVIAEVTNEKVRREGPVHHLIYSARHQIAA